MTENYEVAERVRVLCVAALCALCGAVGCGRPLALVVGGTWYVARLWHALRRDDAGAMVLALAGARPKKSARAVCALRTHAVSSARAHSAAHS